VIYIWRILLYFFLSTVECTGTQKTSRNVLFGNNCTNFDIFILLKFCCKSSVQNTIYSWLHSYEKVVRGIQTDFQSLAAQWNLADMCSKSPFDYLSWIQPVLRHAQSRIGCLALRNTRGGTDKHGSSGVTVQTLLV